MRAIYVDGYRVEDGVGNYVLMLWVGGGVRWGALPDAGLFRLATGKLT